MLTLKINIPQENIHKINSELGSIEFVADEYEKELKKYFPKNNENYLDILLLGMGSDGHIASLFPNDPDLDSKIGVWVRNVHPPDYQLSIDRITITLEFINKSKNIIVLLKEKGKKDIIKHLRNDDEIEFSKYPAGKIRPINGNVSWYIAKE